jgi:hypothetical protein
VSANGENRRSRSLYRNSATRPSKAPLVAIIEPAHMGHYIEKHRQHDDALPRDIQERLLCGRLARPVARIGPPKLIAGHLGLDAQFMEALRKDEAPIVPV